MSKKRWLVSCVGTVSLIASGSLLVCCLFQREERIGQENFARIDEGMTFDEAKAILGQPSVNAGRAGAPKYIWIGDEDAIVIDFDPDYLVKAAHLDPSWCTVFPLEPLWKRLLRATGL